MTYKKKLSEESSRLSPLLSVFNLLSFNIKIVSALFLYIKDHIIVDYYFPKMHFESILQREILCSIPYSLLEILFCIKL